MTGTIAALSAAAFWAIATRLFRGMSSYWSAASLALIKSLVSLVLFLAWALATDLPLLDQQFHVILWLVVSGIVGIAIGDTALFMALYQMGERQTLLVSETAAPVFVLLSAFLLLAEQVAMLQLLGIVIVIVSVDWVIGLRKGGTHFDLRGVFWALIAAACHCFGVLVSRLFLVETEITAEATALWRIAGACLALPVWLVIRRESLKPAMRVDIRVVVKLSAGILLGTFFGIWLLQLSIALLPAGIAQTLIATSALFAVVIAALAGEKVESRQWVGVISAIAGVALISVTS